MSFRSRAMAADRARKPFHLDYDAPEGIRGFRVDHIFWGVVSIGILAVLLSLLLMMLMEDFPASSSSGRRRPKLKS